MVSTDMGGGRPPVPYVSALPARQGQGRSAASFQLHKGGHPASLLAPVGMGTGWAVGFVVVVDESGAVIA